MKQLLGALSALFWASMAHATCAPPPFVFAPGQVIESSKMNANLQALVGCINAIPSPQGQTTIDPRAFGLLPAVKGFFTVSTIGGTGAVTVNGANFVQTHVGQYIRIAGAGPHELFYIGQIVGVSGSNTISVTPSPTQTMTSFSTLVYFGPDGSGPINAACTAAQTASTGVHFPAGAYMVAHPIQCNVVNYNNLNIPPPTVGADAGTSLIAASAMTDSLPAAGTLFTIGGYANGSDYSQYIRSAFIDGGGLTLDCSFICNYAFSLPFSLDSGIQNFAAKNALVAGFHIGTVGAPAVTGGIFASRMHVDRDIFYVPITSITAAHPPVVTTAIDHGVTTGRIVSIIGSNQVPGSVTGTGPISFIATSTGARTLTLHNIDGSGWPATSGSPLLALSFPTNVLPLPVFAVSTANPAEISTQGDLNMADGQTWCVYGVGGTGGNGTTAASTNVPDGCYVISSVGGAGADGPFHFTVPVNTAGFTFTGGGIIYRKDTIADMGFYLDNVSDVQVTDSIVNGTRWPFYNNPSVGGYNGKYSHNHVYNYPEQGWITAGHFLGGSNSLLGEQIDTPAIFGAQFSAGANSSTGFGFNGSFPFVYDGRSWVFQMDSILDTALSAAGTNANGYSGAIRANILANHFMAGRPDYYGSIFNYQQFGFGNPNGTILYSMPDSGRLKPAVQGNFPGGSIDTASLTVVAGGLGAGGCVVTPRYSGVVKLEITGDLRNNTVGDGAYAQLYYGTGTAPVAGAAFGGGVAALGNSKGITLEPTGGGSMSVPFNVSGVVALTLNTTYWFDAAFRAVTGGIATIGNPDCNAQEQ